MKALQGNLTIGAPLLRDAIGRLASGPQNVLAAEPTLFPAPPATSDLWWIGEI